MFLTADEAYKISEYNNKDNIDQQLDDILNRIIQATEKGKFEISCDRLNKENKKKLKKLGYKVKTDEFYYEKFYIISWRKKNKLFS